MVNTRIIEFSSKQVNNVLKTLILPSFLKGNIKKIPSLKDLEEIEHFYF